MRFQTKFFLLIFVIQFILSLLTVITTEFAIVNGAIETNSSSAIEQALYGRPVAYLLYFVRRFVIMILPVGGYYAFRLFLYNSIKVNCSKFKQFDLKFCERFPLILPVGVLFTVMLYTVPDVYNNLEICWYFLNVG